jgi:hypothetical protein
MSAAREALAKAKKETATPGETYTSLRGSLKTLESNLETEASRNKPFPATSTGRRSALAAWITDSRNPLTARVAVNHIWARHFGQPLVATVFDFGRKGSPPTMPAVLDYLAVDLRENGWDMKRLHRIIVTSAVYRMTSSAAGASANDLALDPENKCLWRMNPIRMESEDIRDSLLCLSGELDASIGGPPIAVTDEASKRRSVYFFHSHNDEQKFLSTFDEAGVLECYRRAESIVPQQALAMENSAMVMAAAGKIARRIEADAAKFPRNTTHPGGRLSPAAGAAVEDDRPPGSPSPPEKTRTPIEASDDAAFIESAFSLILGSQPNSDEMQACQETLKELRDIAVSGKRTDAIMRARTGFVLALLNHNDFVTIR